MDIFRNIWVKIKIKIKFFRFLSSRRLIIQKSLVQNEWHTVRTQCVSSPGWASRYYCLTQLEVKKVVIGWQFQLLDSINVANVIWRIGLWWKEDHPRTRWDREQKKSAGFWAWDWNTISIRWTPELTQSSRPTSWLGSHSWDSHQSRPNHPPESTPTSPNSKPTWFLDKGVVPRDDEGKAVADGGRVEVGDGDGEGEERGEAGRHVRLGLPGSDGLVVEGSAGSRAVDDEVASERLGFWQSNGFRHLGNHL